MSINLSNLTKDASVDTIYNKELVYCNKEEYLRRKYGFPLTAVLKVKRHYHYHRSVSFTADHIIFIGYIIKCLT